VRTSQISDQDQRNFNDMNDFPAPSSSSEGLAGRLRSLRAEVYQLKASESRKLGDCKDFRAALAEGWSKLVSLRGYVAKFRREIEECVLEDVKSRNGGSSDSVPFASSSSSPSSPARLIATPSRAEQMLAERGYSPSSRKEMQSSGAEDASRAAVLELQQRREMHRARMIASESALISLRTELEAAAALLMETRQVKSGESTNGKTVLEKALEARKSVLELSKKLELAEGEYVTAVRELDSVEEELSRSLKELAESTSSNPSAPSPPPIVAFKSLTNPIGSPLKLSDLDHIAGDSAPIVRMDIGSLGVGTTVNTGGKRGRQQVVSFTVDEVVEGRAAIARLNGESAAEYCSRLQGRLAMLIALDTSVVAEVEGIRGQYQTAQKDAKELEYQRMRAELQLSNIERLVVEQQLQAIRNDQQPIETSETNAVRSILRSGLALSSDGQSRVVAGRKNVAFTDDGEMVIKLPSSDKEAVDSKFNDLSSPVHSPYDR